jgi:hypothetical protein
VAKRVSTRPPPRPAEAGSTQPNASSSHVLRQGGLFLLLLLAGFGALLLLNPHTDVDIPERPEAAEAPAH